MYKLFLTLSVTASALFGYVVLTKLGLPGLLAIPLAMLVAFILWQFEKQDDDENGKSPWDYLSALFDIREIFKYARQIF